MSSASRQQNSDVVSSPPGSPTSPRKFRSRQPSTSHASTTPTQRRLPRRTSAASITSSIGGALDSAGTPAEETTQYSQNAISTLLAPPIVRTGLVPHTSLPASAAYRAPTARDIPPVTLTQIPHVETSFFREYLSQVGPVFDSFHRAKQVADDNASRSASRRRPSVGDDYFGNGPASPQRQDQLSPLESPSRFANGSVASPLSPSGSSRTPRAGTSRRPPAGPTPLSTIPNVYFDDDFHLENPRTFDVVSEYSEIVPPERGANREDAAGTANGAARPPGAPPRRALHTNALLQEKLSWYMDTVEVHLISAISSASTSFFTALGSLKELQAEATNSIGQIKDLREVLKTLDGAMAVGGLELVNMRRRRENLGRLFFATEQLCEVVEQARTCESLVEEGEVESATAAIEKLEALVDGKVSLSDETAERPRIDLRRLKALEGVSEGIQDLRSRIGKGFEERFRGALLSDLREHVKAVPAKDTLQRWANASFRGKAGHTRTMSTTPAYLKGNEQLRPSLTAALAGLNKAGHSARATTAYREALMREIKGMIRQHLPSSSDDDAESMTSVSTRGGRKLTQQEKSAILARNLRALDAEATEDLLVKIYTSIGEALRRLGYQVKVLLDVTVTIDTSPKQEDGSSDEKKAGTPALSDEVTQALDMSSLLGQAVDLVHNQVTKVLKVRREENTHLPLSDFLRYFVLNRLFVDECEAVCGRGGDAMKEIVNNQIREFLTVMAEQQKAKISEMLDSDRWDAKDFGAAQNKVLSRVLEGMTSTPKEWTDYTYLWQAEEAGESEANGASNGEEPVEKARSAVIDGQKYLLVNASHGALSGIDDFAHLIAAIPQLAPDAATQLLAYLKFFNSRACQLILGAGATKSAGLKNITTKHLALASQTCSFIVALLPYVRELVRRHLPTSTAATSSVLGEFDRVKRLFQDHQTSIHEKLVDIMSSRSAAHVTAFRKVDWNSQTTSKSAEELCRETSILHRTLSRHVSEVDLRMIMNPIFAQYREDWPKAVREAAVTTAKGRERLEADVELINIRLGKLDGADGFLEELRKAVKEGKPDDSKQDSSVSVDEKNEVAQKKSDEEEKAPEKAS